MKEYLLTFASFYKARYALEILEGKGQNAAIQRAPTELAKSCGYALRFQTDEISFYLNEFFHRNLFVNGVFEIIQKDGREYYMRKTIR